MFINCICRINIFHENNGYNGKLVSKQFIGIWGIIKNLMITDWPRKKVNEKTLNGR